MSYRVFARKYRPQKFSELVGQTPIIQTLQNAITSNRLAQAYLFVGPRGVGKTSTARIFAKALNCVKGPTIDPCGICDACVEIAEGRNLDVLEIDGASNNSVESIRTLRENAAFAPAQGRYKIYLIDEVHMLTTAAFNALLKTLEEPPPHVKFLFATTEAQKVPATIVSRCQRFDLHRLSEELISKHLLEIAAKEKVTLTPEAALALAHGADGALRDAESMLDQVISFCGTHIQAKDVQEVFGFTPRETVHQLATAVFQQETSTALALLLEQSNAGKDLSRLLADFIGFVRDLLVEKVSPTSSDSEPVFMIAAADERQGVDGAQQRSVYANTRAASTGATQHVTAAVEHEYRFSLFATLGSMVSTEKLLQLLEQLGNAESQLRWSTNKKLQLDVIIIKAIHLLEEVSLSDVLEALADLADPQSASQKTTKKMEDGRWKMKATTPSSVAISNSGVKKIDCPSDNIADVTSASTLSFDSCETASPISHLPSSISQASSASMPPDLSLQSSSNLWTPVAEQLSSESKLKFGWMTSGKFLEQRGNKIVVEFPLSCEAQTETLFWPQARKKIQECLSKNSGTPMELVTQFTGEKSERIAR